MSTRIRIFLLLGLGFFFLIYAKPWLSHETSGQVTYLGNEGVMVQKGRVKILFDPIYNQNFNTYLLVPKNIRNAIMAGEAPYDGIDVVFISHAHSDHFSAEPMLEFLRRHPKTKLVASAQAVEKLGAVSTPDDQMLFKRITTLSLAPDDPPISFWINTIKVDAVRIPHAGGPGRANVQNYIFRVGLDAKTGVMHLGDADPSLRFFTPLDKYWKARQTQLVMPPYWFFLSDDGRAIMQDHLNADRYTGIHVPANADALRQQYPDALNGADLFTTPGETRVLD